MIVMPAAKHKPNKQTSRQPKAGAVYRGVHEQAPVGRPRFTLSQLKRAVKAAILEYTLTQAAALAGKRIRVNCIAPGSIEFPGGTWARAKANNPNLYAGILRSIPVGRLGRPEEIAAAALFLASEDASFVTGAILHVDGGQTAEV